MLEIREDLVGLGWRVGQVWQIDAGFRSYLIEKPGEGGKRCGCVGAHAPRSAVSCLLDRMNIPPDEDGGS